MKITSKDVRLPKCVRDGKVKKEKKKNKQVKYKSTSLIDKTLISEGFDLTEHFHYAGLDRIKDTMRRFAKLEIIEELKKHIKHPNKPGYKRKDIVKRIEELEDELKRDNL